MNDEIMNENTAPNNEYTDTDTSAEIRQAEGTSDTGCTPPPYSSISDPEPEKTKDEPYSVFAEQDFRPADQYGQPYNTPYAQNEYCQNTPYGQTYGQPGNIQSGYSQPAQPDAYGQTPQYGYGQPPRYSQTGYGQTGYSQAAQYTQNPQYTQSSQYPQGAQYNQTVQTNIPPYTSQMQNGQGMPADTQYSAASQNGYDPARRYSDSEQPYSPYRYNTPAQPAPEPVIPPLSAPSETKKTSSAVMIIMTVIVVVLLTVVMILLAIKAKDTPAESGLEATVAPSQAGSVTVNIEMDKRPAEDKSDYADEEKGLFTVQGAVRYALPSVVSLYGYKDGTPAAVSSASGTILSKDGYIVTNAHVVDDVDDIGVTLCDGKKFKGKIIASDQRTDVAIVKIEATDLTPAVIGSADDLVQGDTVITIGNADGFENSVTTGIVSYNDRKIQSYTGYDISCIQTDAALNHGQSGGAVIDLYGRVVGIVVSKYYSSETENLGFAIRSEEFVPVCEDLIAKGFVPGRPRMGIVYNFINADYAERNGLRTGAYVTEISSDCDIAKTDLKVGDIITEVGDVKFTTANDVKKISSTYKPGDKVKAKVFRKDQFSNDEGEEFEIEFTFEEFKD